MGQPEEIEGNKTPIDATDEEKLGDGEDLPAAGKSSESRVDSKKDSHQESDSLGAAAFTEDEISQSDTHES